MKSNMSINSFCFIICVGKGEVKFLLMKIICFHWSNIVFITKWNPKDRRWENFLYILMVLWLGVCRYQPEWNEEGPATDSGLCRPVWKKGVLHRQDQRAGRRRPDIHCRAHQRGLYLVTMTSPTCVSIFTHTYSPISV